MKKTYQIIIVVFLSLFLYGCGNQAAIDDAKAYQIRVETDSKALSAEQLRLANIATAEQKAIDDAYWNDIWNSIKSAVTKSITILVYSVIVAVCIMILGGSWAGKDTVIGLGQARVARAMLEANLIHMDEVTRTFPAFKLTTIGGDHFITMLADGQVLKLDKETAANPLLIAALAQVSTTGVYSREASKAAMVRGNEVQPFDPALIIGEVRNVEASKND